MSSSSRGGSSNWSFRPNCSGEQRRTVNYKVVRGGTATLTVFGAALYHHNRMRSLIKDSHLRRSIDRNDPDVKQILQLCLNRDISTGALFQVLQTSPATTEWIRHGFLDMSKKGEAHMNGDK